MSRFKDAEPILAAADRWKQRCLLGKQSLFADRPLWTGPIFQEVRKVHAEAKSVDDIRSGLERASADAKCLRSEMVWVYRLIQARKSMGAVKKREDIGYWWGRSGRAFAEDHELLSDTLLGAGVVNAGLGYNTRVRQEIRFFANAMSEWSSLERSKRESLLDSPWDFASWLDDTEFADGSMFRHAMLFLLFPEEFEPIISSGAKKTIVGAMRDPGHEKPADWVERDKEILAIRRRLEEVERGRSDDGAEPDVHFHHEPYKELWDRDSASAWFGEHLGDACVWHINMNFDEGASWPGVVEDGVASIGWDNRGDLHDIESQDDMLRKLDLGKGSKSIHDALCLWQFSREIKPGDIILATRKGKEYIAWGRVTGAYRYDPDGGRFRKHTVSVDWHRCEGSHRVMGGNHPPKRLSETTRWVRWIRQALWLMGDCEGSDPCPDDDVYTSEDATKDLFLPTADFERFLHLMGTRRNLILQGPPGTGKTFIAKRLAWCLIGCKDSDPIEMVQFHQSYAYEDFVQGYRPTESGGFKLRHGVFHRFCERARRNSETPHVFIIDEINRGNLSRIFGELLMLIEADKRSEEYAVSLTYADPSGRRFHIPDNVYILGMMNTADRSLALVDYALRRRFAFATLNPAYGTEYGRSAFQNHLEGQGVAGELVTRIIERMAELNEEIANDPELGRGFRVGHSYFVPTEKDAARDETWYETVVDAQIEPLLAEYWFDSQEKIDTALGRLREAPKPNDVG